ncbi:MAG TPA: PEFG-CTERM sorting domain-containing protein [Nitrosarchaeum sp.]|nr:PEFG-CTERM sorting domain-containing protein [Nitrosarchaeum sp.]
MNLKYGFVVMMVSLFTMSSFYTNVFAEDVSIQSPLSLGSNHDGIMTTTQTSSFDGSIVVFLTATEPVKGEHMTISVRFIDTDGKEIQNINYDIIATQNEQVILSETMVNQHIGNAAHLTQILPSSDLVNIQITLKGMESHPITVSQGKPIDIIVVPEFGTITMMILVVSIMSIVIISTKNKITLKL